MSIDVTRMPAATGEPVLVILHGRARELQAMSDAADRILAGQSSTLVLAGSAGVGKTALLSALADRVVAPTQLLSIEGVESEAGLAFAALHRLMRPLLGGLELLPPPQRAALESVFGLDSAAAPDRFVVGLATLTVLTAAAAENPIVCIVDDAEWLDPESLEVLEFVARRLQADPVAVFFAVRNPSHRRTRLLGLPELDVSTLTVEAAREMLTQLIGPGLSEPLVTRILDTTAGNPLALVELAREYTQDELERDALRPQPLALGNQVEQRYLRTFSDLPAPTQLLLLAAAADPTGDLVVLERAAGSLGANIDALGAAEDAGLISVSAQVAFRHPLVRSAVYGAAAPPDRRTVHRALADASDPETDAERRAWHLAAGAEGPDESIATELSSVSRLIGARGGSRSQVELLVRAAELSESPGARAKRYFFAAAVSSLTGGQQRASTLIVKAMVTMQDGEMLARARWLDGILLLAQRNYPPVPGLLLSAARSIDEFDSNEAQSVVVDATVALGLARNHSENVGPTDLLQAVAALRGTGDQAPPTARLLLLRGYASTLEADPLAAIPTLEEALDAWIREAPGPQEINRWVLLPIWAGLELWDDDKTRAVIEDGLRQAREQHHVSAVQVLLFALSKCEILAGRFAVAEAIHAESHDLNMLIDQQHDFRALITGELAAWRGIEGPARQTIAAMREMASRHGYGAGLCMADLAEAVLGNGTSQYGDALEASRRLVADPFPGYHSQALSELVEAAARLGSIDEARDAAAHISDRAEASGTPLALGIRARCTALVTEGPEAEGWYRSSIEHLEITSSVTALARTHLLFGEWLRRERRRVEAREQLRIAHQMFNEMGAEGFAERAATELAATGETARKRTVDAANDLTPQEWQVATLAAAGATNAKIAEQLFLSANTIDYHLRNVYRKLDVHSRRALSKSLPD